ncbi:Patatin-like phospholipase [Luteitalea pratensis]|uniref:Patatin-like phospholipase n=1 Tax=Luteitalea pratensis TaxID=1855912 RepID=A0A143PEP7_LUTPR|nr:patatin-like phospholipase family protein [Luteitalea pratensis]AMY06926.1 Patatin-like phospholipase [Luteitalea pratensis]
MGDLTKQARSFLAGECLYFKDADALWRGLRDHENEPSLARAVLARLRDSDRESEIVIDRFTRDRSLRAELCQQEALLTSKDEELSAAARHTRAIELLENEFGDLLALTDAETLGIAAGIYKRKWFDLGQLPDLEESAKLYQRGAEGELGDDAYPHINAAFLEDVLAARGSNPVVRQARATALRERIVAELPVKGSWWNAATRAEALFGLRRYAEATATLADAKRPPLWKLETTARQLATLAHLHTARPLEQPAIRQFFEALLPGASAAVRSAFIGKVGLALSGGGFRASFYHLGVLARLAELDVLRHVDVLSCVSGGSIVGAAYWLAVRERLLDPAPMGPDAYMTIVRRLIKSFSDSVALDLRAGVQPSKAAVAIGFLFRSKKGAMNGEEVADLLEENFYRRFLPGKAGPIYMDDLPFTPADYDAKIVNEQPFNPSRHNWLRAHKVPALVINATTVNTGHGWQFTPTWMGESPWAVHEDTDLVPRLQWSRYDRDHWRMRLGRAVAASACVPGVFEPMTLDAPYKTPMDVKLVDGGVYDNQGTVALLASNCNVLLVSDASGQLMLEPRPTPGVKGLLSYASRAMDTLMERVRQSNYGDLSSRRMTGLVRGMMFLHLKAGLDADPIRLSFADEAYTIRRSTLSPSGVRKDLQQAIAELRTDLNVFTPDESQSLMACGYQMASKMFEYHLGHLHELADAATRADDWPFAERLKDLTSTSPRDLLLAKLQAGQAVEL